MGYQVLIPCAGTGSRLFEETKFINKSLVHLNNTPIISHILEKFPKDCQFVIPVGYKSADLIDYLKIAHSELDIIIEEVFPFEGPGSSLGFTLSKVLHHINQPFVFISCDTLINDPIPAPNENWIGFSRVIDSSNYATIDIDDQGIKSINKKLDSESLNAYIGLSGINDYENFKELAKNNDGNFIEEAECYPISQMLSVFKPIEFSWFDTGNIPSLHNTRKIFGENNKKLFNILEKENEKIWFTNDKVIKFSDDKDFILNRIKRADLLKQYVPKIIDIKPNMYSYKFTEGEVLSSKVNLDLFKKLLDNLVEFWDEKTLSDAETVEFYQLCFEFYKDKTFSRVESFMLKYPYSNKEIYLNGKSIEPPFVSLEKIDWNYLSKGIAVNFHGDLHFENILLSNEGKFVFLDWRQSFNGKLDFGDIYYDLAKLLHGILLPHEIVNKGGYEITESENTVTININIPHENIEIAKYFQQWCNENHYDFKKIRLLCSLIYLNIASLHHHPYSKFLFYYGLEMLNNNNE